MLSQCDLFDYGAEGSRPSPRPAPTVEDEVDYISVPHQYRGRRCARCGKPLNGGGLVLVGHGFVCWSCYSRGGGR